MEHLVNDLLHCRLQAWTFPAGIEARWLGEGILQLLPTAPWRRATILSAACMAMRPRRLNCCCS